jgi:starch synthase
METIRVGLVTKEWPPHVYGGAGVHVVQLVQALRKRAEIALTVHCFGEERADAIGYKTPTEFINSNPAIAAVATDLAIADALAEVDIVHSHTWYANMAGHVASLIHGIPHIMSGHSLEPRRPWKAEQLGGGYQLSSWVEKTAIENAAAVIAVSDGMRADILSAYPNVEPSRVHTIRNGVDTEKFSPRHDPSVLAKYEIAGRYALFVGRITRQKGLAHLLRAWKEVPSEYGLVIAAGSPDEPGIGSEIAELIEELKRSRSNVWWIQTMLPHEELTAVLTAADLFLCPSIYEPLGIVNLEAMGCATAVLGSAVGGIPEVVVDGVTGKLVEYSTDHQIFEANLSEAIISLMGKPELLITYGNAGRARVQSEFGWDAIAETTHALYSHVLSR